MACKRHISGAQACRAPRRVTAAQPSPTPTAPSTSRRSWATRHCQLSVVTLSGPGEAFVVTNVGPTWVVLAWWVGWRVVANVGPTLGSDLHVGSSAWRSGQVRSRVELFEQIRRDRRPGDRRSGSWRSGIGCTGARCGRRWPARCRRRGRRTRSGRGRRSSRGRQVIDEWLVADQDVPRKQRHTARRVWQRLVAEHDAAVAELTVSRYVARRRAELGLDPVEVTVPQTHEPGAEAEVDFGEFHASGRRGAGEVLDVRDAPVALGQGVPCRVRHPGPGGVPGGPRAGVRALRRGAGPGPLRQPRSRR